MRSFFCFILALGNISGAFSQSAQEIDALLTKPVMRWDDVCLWTFMSAGISYSKQDAASYAFKYKAIPSNTAQEAPADLAGLALLIMRVYDRKGGVFYTLFQNRRYAFREFVYLGIFDREDDPKDTFSGAKFVRILSDVQNLDGGIP